MSIIFHQYYDTDPKLISSLTITSVEDLKFFRIILRRSLNCLPPHETQWKQWFELCDKLDTILGA